MKRASVSSLNPQHRRRGGALIIAILALAVASMIGATLLQMAFTQRRQLQHERLRTQAGWLAEAGLQRALQQIASDPEYQGETWMVDVPDRTASQPAEVLITVDTETKSVLTVVATYPRGATFRAKVRRSVSVPMKAE